MNSLEKYDKMLSLKPYADRTEMPVYPMILTWCGKAAGIKQSEIIASNKSWIKAMDKTFSIVGKPDCCMPTSAGQAVFAMTMPARIPGRDLDDDVLYQFIEKPNMTEADYDLIAKEGWNAFFYPYCMRIQNPELKSKMKLILKFVKLGILNTLNTKHFNKEGMATSYDYAVYPPFDMMSLIRSFEPFLMDLIDEDLEGKIQDALRKANPEVIKDCIANTKRFGGKKICIYAMRSSCSFVSSDIFEEFSWPYLKEMILEFHKAGIISVIHADGNWLPHLHYFKDLPKGCVHFELDGTTDIFKAYEILGGYQSMRGDVPSTLFAFKTPDDVREYCEKLIKLGMNGGFMLGSGCEVPLNAKAENVKAMIDSVR